MSLKADIKDKKNIKISLSGNINFQNAAKIHTDILKNLKSHPLKIILDFENVNNINSAALGMLSDILIQSKKQQTELSIENASSNVKKALKIASYDLFGISEKRKEPALFERLGLAMENGFEHFLELVNMVYATLYWGIIGPFKGAKYRWNLINEEGIKIGVNAFPIVALISLLIGLIMAFQAAYQLRQFGANIFVANLVSVSMTRELGPLMTAIILAGRSGSSITAELGTMVVSEEVDALKTMGLNPVQFLVVPKIIAMTFAGPCLTVFSIFLGNFGGFLIATMYLDLSATAYINQTIQALMVSDLFAGIVKSLVFSWIIVTIGCYKGFSITGGAVGVGKSTTESVVTSIFAIILADSAITTTITLLG